MAEFFAYNGLLNVITAALVGCYILVYHRNEDIAGISLFFVFAFGLWSFGYWRWLLESDNPSAALFWTRVLSLGATLIPVAFLHWALAFLNAAHRHANLIRIAYAVTFVFLLFGFNGLFVASVQPVGAFLFWPQAGPLYLGYIIVAYFGFVGYGLCALWRHYRHEGGLMRNRIRYVLIGLAACAIGGSTNFLPWYGIPFPPFGNLITTVFSLVAAYVVMHYRNHVSSMRLLGRM